MWLGILGALLLAYAFCLPRDLFKDTPYSTVVTDRNGELLGARIAPDGQWRFPPCKTVPEKYAVSVIEFEDRYFRIHPGVNPVAIGRALIGNIRAGHVTSGGSTLTMQVIRMSRGKERTLWQKCVEAVLATRLELRCRKKTILAMYASHAPFGGNVVGLDAASWRYFGRPPEELSWGEAATLAVLPNSPASIHPGRNRESLLEKRNRLLLKLYKRNKLDSLSYVLACGEPLPGEPKPLPELAPHLTEYHCALSPGRTVRTTVDAHLQERVAAITDEWCRDLTLRGINDLAAVIMDVHSGEILAYVGNSLQERNRPGKQVDIVRAPRSTGSILKPLLFCALLQDGLILPETLIPDTPINLGGFSPQNFDRSFSGAVPAAEALTRSLNVPAVHMLRRFGVPRFHGLLKSLGMTTLTRSPDYYGLSLILGGAEGALLDITGIYASLSRNYQQVEMDADFPLADRCAIWHTFEALKELSRPDELDMRLVSSVRKVAWKTGTSYGFRDAWAVGVTPGYAVGVWAGNAQGQGVPGLVGARAAGPVLFDLFNVLPPEKGQDGPYAADGWFLEPGPHEYSRAEVCPESGHLKGIHCPKADTLMVPPTAMRSEPCPYHREVGGEVYFILPPAMEWYYRQNHPEYHPPQKAMEGSMEFIYPEPWAEIAIPKQLSGEIKGMVFNLAHRNPSTTVWWHLDNDYVGETRYVHQLQLTPPPGRHTMTCVDESGESCSVTFTIL